MPQYRGGKDLGKNPDHHLTKKIPALWNQGGNDSGEIGPFVSLQAVFCLLLGIMEIPGFCREIIARKSEGKFMSTEIEVEISESGEVKIHVKGIKGKQCLSVTGELESLLGGVVDRNLTEE